MNYINELDWKFIKKIVDDNTLMFKTKITTEFFNDVLAKIIYSLIVKNINDKGVFFPLSDLKILIDDSERIDKLKIINYPFEVSTVENLIEHLNSFKDETINFLGLDKTITERHLRKKMKDIAGKIESDIANSTTSTPELLRRYSNQLDQLMYCSDEDRVVLSSEDILREEIFYQNDETKDLFAKTGTIIDIENGGLNSPSLTVICGGAKTGKSVSLYQCLIESLNQGRTVLFGTIEISSSEAYRKILSAYIGVDYSSISKKDLSPEDKDIYLEKVKEFTTRFKDKLFIYYKRSGFCCKDIEIYNNNLKKAGIIIEDIILDYLFIMKSNEPSNSLVDTCMKLPTEVRILSQITNTRVITAAQLRSDAEKIPIEDLGFDNIFYMKGLQYEATYTIVLKTIKGKDGIDQVFSKCLASRQMWSNTIYHFPNVNFNQIYLGYPEECLYQTSKDIQMSDQFIV